MNSNPFRVETKIHPQPSWSKTIPTSSILVQCLAGDPKLIQSCLKIVFLEPHNLWSYHKPQALLKSSCFIPRCLVSSIASSPNASPLQQHNGASFTKGGSSERDSPSSLFHAPQLPAAVPLCFSSSHAKFDLEPRGRSVRRAVPVSLGKQHVAHNHQDETNRRI